MYKSVPSNDVQIKQNPLSNCSDAELLAQVAEGNKTAFRALYLRHHHRIQQFILRMIRHSDIGDEILNDTFFTVWKNAVEFKNDSQVTTWIFGICYRKCLKALERDQRWRSRHRDSSAIESFLIERQFWPDAEAARSQLKHQLTRQMRNLPAEQRMVLELTYFFGFSYPEIADIADIPVNTVKTRMFHARRKMRQLMDSRAMNINE